jgi:hypothetical protein|tara:strand:+ start:182 stop:535 length:354 start_codon:yes stop_codon:yes gene_type:complete
MPNLAAEDYIFGTAHDSSNSEENEGSEFWISKKPSKITEHNIRYDPVNKPEHYNRHNTIECIEAIEACTGSSFAGYLQGNAMKYLWRYRYKDNSLQDLEKAKWYLSKLIEDVKKEDK